MLKIKYRDQTGKELSLKTPTEELQNDRNSIKNKLAQLGKTKQKKGGD